MAKDVTPNYSAAQVSIMVAAALANGGIADLTLAETLAANPEMDAPADSKQPGPRKPRAIVAKLRRLADDKELGITYKRKEPTTKSGKPVTNKVALVKEIAAMADVAFADLDGLEKAPKGALEVLRDTFAAYAEDEAEAA
jgi:hypothetical protein